MFRVEIFPEDLTTDVVSIIEEFCDVGARMQDIKSIVSKDKPEIITPQKGLEHCTGADAFVQVFLDKQLEKESHNEPCKEYQRQDDKSHHHDNRI